MKFAVFSDVHANYNAMVQFLKEMDQFQPERIFCLGDMIGYDQDSDKVIELILSQPIECILGNHEYALLEKLKVYPDLSCYRLNKKHLEFIHSLPISISVPEMDTLFHHAVPGTINDYFYVNSDFSKLAGLQHKRLFMGHTHYPMYLSWFHKKIFNPGSLGQPRDGVPQGSWLEISQNFQNIHFKRIPS